MTKQVINADDVPATGGPFNLCIRHGDMIYVSGLPPFDAEYLTVASSTISRRTDSTVSGNAIRRAGGCVMDHLQSLVDAAGSNMDCC